MKRNDQKGPIIVLLDKHEWATIKDEFGEAECGGNLPVGWILWRVYSVNIPGYYKPVLIKKSDSEETKCYRVHDEWLNAVFSTISYSIVKCSFVCLFVNALDPCKINIEKYISVVFFLRFPAKY